MPDLSLLNARLGDTNLATFQTLIIDIFSGVEITSIDGYLNSLRPTMGASVLQSYFQNDLNNHQTGQQHCFHC